MVVRGNRVPTEWPLDFAKLSIFFETTKNRIQKKHHNMQKAHHEVNRPPMSPVCEAAERVPAACPFQVHHHCGSIIQQIVDAGSRHPRDRTTTAS